MSLLNEAIKKWWSQQNAAIQLLVAILVTGIALGGIAWAYTRYVHLLFFSELEFSFLQTTSFVALLLILFRLIKPVAGIVFDVLLMGSKVEALIEEELEEVFRERKRRDDESGKAVEHPLEYYRSTRPNELETARMVYRVLKTVMKQLGMRGK